MSCCNHLRSPRCIRHLSMPLQTISDVYIDSELLKLLLAKLFRPGHYRVQVRSSTNNVEFNRREEYMLSAELQTVQSKSMDFTTSSMPYSSTPILDNNAVLTAFRQRLRVLSNQDNTEACHPAKVILTLLTFSNFQSKHD